MPTTTCNCKQMVGGGRGETLFRIRVEAVGDPTRNTLQGQWNSDAIVVEGLELVFQQMEENQDKTILDEPK
ncbi:hypothetical protein HPP92_028972 [Vanilla planifolia]|uniref:Uncharacterized protein n=1 Tax=Vanilla planifolia TaxID=51239 RepID=A0A835P8Y6_VANPL|nr:hypothetical protein HPP92_028972 [Vanilla planifolia]KAG0446172.1 hypothetical protein HPP92_028961 [Vanilla planifolia]